MPGTHQKTVTVVPVDDAYAWSAIDDLSNSTATWVTIAQQGSTDTWDFTVVDNPSSAARSATCTVLHSNGVTSDFFTIDQAGSGGVSTPTGSYDTLNGTPSSINEDGSSVTFTVAGSNLQAGTIQYALTGTGITSNDVGVGMNGTITMTGGVSNTGSLTVPILADNFTEGAETLVCTLAGTDSNGISTGNLSTSVVINDTSQNPTYSYQINWDESAATQSNWVISSTAVTSNNVTNVSNGAVVTSFTGTPGDTVLITLTAGATTGMDFTQVGSNAVITSANNSGLSILSEDLTMSGWPDQLTFSVSWVLPGSSAVTNATYDATTIAESSTRLIALHGPLAGSWTCNETTVDITANYEDIGPAPQPAVGDSLSGVSPNGQADYLVVAGSGLQSTTGSATGLIGQVLSITEQEIMFIAPCNPSNPSTTLMFSPGPSPSPYSPSPSPSPSPTPYNPNIG